MRVIVDLRDNLIIQGEKDPPVGEGTTLNGKYHFPLPDGVNVSIHPGSVILPYSDPNSIVSASFSALLKNHPQYSNIIFNPLITSTDLEQLDMSGTLNLPPDSFTSRVQMGRPLVPPIGNAPGSVALLPAGKNPGVLVTTNYDISIQTGGLGASNFCVYWKVFQVETSVDVRASKGKFSGKNLPCIKKTIEIDQEEKVQAFISPNDGIDWFQVGRLTPISLCSATNFFRVAFKGEISEKVYFASYAILF